MPTLSGQLQRVRVLPSPTNGEDFEEPDLELISRTELAGASVGAAEQDGGSARPRADVGRTFDELTLRNLSLQTDLAQALEALRSRESELDELRKLLQTGPPTPPADFEARDSTSALPVAPPLPPIEQKAASAPAPVTAGWIRSGTTLFELAFIDGCHFFGGLAPELSERGLFIATYNVLPVGAAVEVELELANGAKLELAGRVAWLREQPAPDRERPGMGIELNEGAVESLSRVAGLREGDPALFVEL